MQYGANLDGRWAGLVEIIRETQPHLLMLQECDWLAHRDQAAHELGMCLVVAPSWHLPTAVAWDPDVPVSGGLRNHLRHRIAPRLLRATVHHSLPRRAVGGDQCPPDAVLRPSSPQEAQLLEKATGG